MGKELSKVLMEEGLKLYLVEDKEKKVFMIGYDQKLKLFNLIPYTHTEYIARIDFSNEGGQNDKIPFKISPINHSNQNYQERLNSLTRKVLAEFYGEKGKPAKKRK